jgi:DNA processing protein
MEMRGAIISELRWARFPARKNFPIRNRVIAGMSLGVMVVEGAQHFGPLITARLAMSLARIS